MCSLNRERHLQNKCFGVHLLAAWPRMQCDLFRALHRWSGRKCYLGLLSTGYHDPQPAACVGHRHEEWALDCEIECELPRPIPAGYLLSTDGEWSCDRANQYSGVASAECTVHVSTCYPILVLSGCFPTTPCDMPAYDRCQHDVPGALWTAS